MGHIVHSVALRGVSPPGGVAIERAPPLITPRKGFSRDVRRSARRLKTNLLQPMRQKKAYRNLNIAFLIAQADGGALD